MAARQVSLRIARNRIALSYALDHQAKRDQHRLLNLHDGLRDF